MAIFLVPNAGGGSGSPAGSNTQIQFNSAGLFGASASLTWDGSTLAVTGDINLGDGAKVYKIGNTTVLSATALGSTVQISSSNIPNGTITNDDLAGSIADGKLLAISSANKVALTALDIDGATDLGSALADSDLLIVDDGGGGANKKAAVTRITDYVFGKVTGDLTIAANGTATAPLASGLVNGFLSSADYSKLAGIEAGAQANVATNLTYTASTRLLESSTGTDVNLPLADGTNAGLMASADFTKLSGIAAGAEVNVNADWNAGSGDAQILNKPTQVSAFSNDAGYITSAGAPVQSVNTKSGAVVLNADDIDDTSTTHKFASQAELTKLAGIATGAEVNVNADWNAGSGDAQILNKPTLGTIAALAAPSGTVVGTTDTQTLTNKTLGDLKETVYTISDGSGVDLDPANGPIQVWTLGASRSPTATNFAAGESMMLMVADGTAYTVTWPSVTWVGGSAPTLATTGYTVVELWKVSTTLYGALVGNVA